MKKGTMSFIERLVETEALARQIYHESHGYIPQGDVPRGYMKDIASNGTSLLSDG